MQRYRVALALGRKEYEEAINEDAQLLDYFGLRLLSVEECVRAAVKNEVRGKKINPWNVIEINGRVWDWMRPLLVKLREHEMKVDVRALAAAK